ncbi:MAG TPA: DMT family transporter [Candidatus Acidoferrales bacterium]|nr:DMT family transporter [Candidatus Acidoferrales bacterium]
MGILLGLTGAISWGIADFAARFAARRVGAYRTLFFMQCIGFLVLTAYLELSGGISRGVAPGWQPWALAACAGVLNTISSLSLYYAFQIGVMSVVAPISSAYPALTVVLSLLSGERIQPLRGAGLAVTLIGVVLAATSFAPESKGESSIGGTSSRAHLTKGVGWAILSAIGFGILFWFLGFHVVPVAGSAFSVWMIRLSTFSTLALFAAPARQTLRLPHGSVWWLLITVGVMDTIAFVANNAALHVGQVAVVSVLASLYGAVTVVLSWIFLRERLERTQWLGIVLIFTGIVLVSL